MEVADGSAVGGEDVEFALFGGVALLLILFLLDSLVRFTQFCAAFLEHQGDTLREGSHNFFNLVVVEVAHKPEVGIFL